MDASEREYAAIIKRMGIPTWDRLTPKVPCSFTICRFCGVKRKEYHKKTCTHTHIRNPIPDVLFGSDDDWFNQGKGTQP